MADLLPQGGGDGVDERGNEVDGAEAQSPSPEQDAGLARFVALHVRQLYNERAGEPLKEPLMLRREFAVVALADVSGYSLLTNTLRTRGNQGAEVLTQLLNPYFHFVIDILEKSGGDVVRHRPRCRLRSPWGAHPPTLQRLTRRGAPRPVRCEPAAPPAAAQVKFIGDAILVKWDMRGRSREETLASACWGCLRLLERLGSHILTLPEMEKVRERRAGFYGWLAPALHPKR